MKLSEMKPDPADMIRPFWYPEGTDAANGIKVTIRYVDTNFAEELTAQIKVRHLNEVKESEEAPADRAKKLTNDFILGAVVRIENVTFRKLATMVPLNAAMVAQNGGIDAAVDMTRDNMIFLLNNCTAFAQWCGSVASNISAFQAGDWEARVKNSSSGQQSNSVKTPSSAMQTD